jgi:hypothetical protein
MPREVPYLNDEQRGRIVETLGAWASVHPRRNLPIVGLADGSELTPLDMANAVADPDSPRGQHLFRVFAAGLIDDDVETPETLDQILDDYRLDTLRWLEQQR